MNLIKQRLEYSKNQRTLYGVNNLITYAELRALRKAVNDYSAAVGYALRKELKYGHKRITRFLDYFQTTFDKINNEQLSIDYCKQILKDEVDIKID